MRVVDLIRWSGRRDVLISAPIVIILLVITNKHIESVHLGVRFHQPVKSPAEGAVEVGGLIGVLVALPEL